MKKRAPDAPTDPVASRIVTLRGQKVILDADLAAIYGVTTKRLNEQCRRNAKRFPADFLFRLTQAEFLDVKAQSSSWLGNDDETLGANRSQIATGSNRHRDHRFLPYAFTETGAIMAANVLNSEQAVRMSVFVVRAFVRMRELLINHGALEKKLAELDARVGDHDQQIAAIVHAIRQLAAPDGPQHGRKIGFNQ